MSNHLVLGLNRAQRTLALPTNKLTRHAAVMGMTGSGKTGLVLGLVEQLIEQDVPSILVDIKGDMCNIALQEADPDLRDKIDIRVLTPGAFHGDPVNLFHNLERPERVKTAVTQILKLCGEKKVDPLSSPAHTYLSTLLHHYHQHNVHADLVTLITGLIEPPIVTLGALSLEDAFSDRRRTALATKLNNLLAAPSFEHWRQGDDLNIDEMYNQKKKNGRTNVTIYSVAHLDEDQKGFALALLFESVVAWMRRQRGTDELRAALVVDECAGILPPYPRNPTTKPPIMTMLKQARAYGLGLVLASQNPMDLDYKALSNCETWLVGRLQMANDRRRVIEAITAATAHDRNKLEVRIGRLQPRDFVLCRPSSTADFRSADVRCKLVGPMAPMEIKAMLGQWDPDLDEVIELLGEQE